VERERKQIVRLKTKKEREGFGVLNRAGQKFHSDYESNDTSTRNTTSRTLQIERIKC
jgi:hypothetical protein